MSLLLFFSEQQEETAQPDLPARRRRTTVIVREDRRKRPRILTPLEEWERERKRKGASHDTHHDMHQLSADDLATAIREDEEWLLMD